MNQYRCTVCGYIYDPEDGDPDSALNRGRRLKKFLTVGYVPVCGAPKESFEKIGSI